MDRDVLKELVRDGWFDGCAAESFDPYYEPSWFAVDD